MADEEQLSAVIVDDHPAVLAGVTHWLSCGTPPIRVAASGSDVRVAWLGEGAQADVVILDLHLGGPTPAMGDLRRLVQAGRRVVVYSMRADDVIALQCLELGALSYLTKAEGTEHLLNATRAAAAGQAYTAPSLAGALAGDRSAHRPVLSARETEVLIQWFQSQSKEFVAQRLGSGGRRAQLLPSLVRAVVVEVVDVLADNGEGMSFVVDQQPVGAFQSAPDGQHPPSGLDVEGFPGAAGVRARRRCRAETGVPGPLGRADLNSASLISCLASSRTPPMAGQQAITQRTIGVLDSLGPVGTPFGPDRARTSVAHDRAAAR